MDHPLIHDRGRGPELVGTRITIYNLVPFFLRADTTEAGIAESFLISVEQVAALRAYFLLHHAEVMAEHEKIEERIRKGYEAQDTPEFRAKWAETRASIELFRKWLGETDTKHMDRDQKFREFKSWLETRELAGASR